LPGISGITVSYACSTTSVNISWNQLSVSTSYLGEITFSSGETLFINSLLSPVSYMITIISSNKVIISNTSNTYYIFTGLNKGTSYTVTIHAVNTLGEGVHNMSTFYLPTIEDARLNGMYICMLYTYIKQ